MRVAWVRAQAGMLSAVFVSGTVAEASGRALSLSAFVGDLPPALSAMRRGANGTPLATAGRQMIGASAPA